MHGRPLLTPVYLNGQIASTFFTHFHAPYFIISSVSVSFPLHLLIFFFFFQIYSSSFTTDQNRETAWKNLQPIHPILLACVRVCPCIYTSISICVYLYTSSLLSLRLGFFLYEKLGSLFDPEWKVVVGSLFSRWLVCTDRREDDDGHEGLL